MIRWIKSLHSVLVQTSPPTLTIVAAAILTGLTIIAITARNDRRGHISIRAACAFSAVVITALAVSNHPHIELPLLICGVALVSVAVGGAGLSGRRGQWLQLAGWIVVLCLMAAVCAVVTSKLAAGVTAQTWWTHCASGALWVTAVIVVFAPIALPLLWLGRLLRLAWHKVRPLLPPQIQQVLNQLHI